jgi:uncharacterized protein DUF4157
MSPFQVKAEVAGLLSVFLVSWCSIANACDPNEACNRCLASAFGHCITHGNDPVCEARKAACHVPVVGPVITGPGMPMGPGGPLGPGGPGIGPITGEDIKFCYSNPNGCPARVLSSTLYSQLAPIVDQYIAYLENQGNGRWQGIPTAISSKIAQYYPDDNLNAVRLAMNVNTVHGQAITIGNDIFFPRTLDLNDRSDIQILLHELEHVGQYARRGGVRPFLAEYIAKIPGKVIAQRSFQIHDELDIEQAAISKSKQVISDYYGWNFYLVNNCSHPVSVALDYKDTNGEWRVVGYWAADPNQGYYLSEDNVTLHSTNRVFYIYAESTDDSGKIWSGSPGNSNDITKTVDSDGRQLNFRRMDVADSNPQDLRTALTCQ